MIGQSYWAMTSPPAYRVPFTGTGSRCSHCCDKHIIHLWEGEDVCGINEFDYLEGNTARFDTGCKPVNVNFKESINCSKGYRLLTVFSWSCFSHSHDDYLIRFFVFWSVKCQKMCSSQLRRKQMTSSVVRSTII